MVRYLQNNSPGGFGLFDSELNNASNASNGNFDLTITLKVYLRPKNDGRKVISDSDHNKFVINNWPAVEWQGFCSIFQSTGQSFWDNKFWLVTPNDTIQFDYQSGRDWGPEKVIGYRTEQVQTCRIAGRFWCKTETRATQNPITYQEGLFRRANLNCRFNLKLEPGPGTAHKTIDVYYVTHRLINGKWVVIRPGRPTGFRSDDSTYSSSDILDEEMRFQGHRILFKTHVHEIGHSLGLEHSAVVRKEPKCIAIIARQGLERGSNNHLCYGTTLESAKDAMGMGTVLSEHDALPWLYVAQQHTGIGKSRWIVDLIERLPPLAPIHS